MLHRVTLNLSAKVIREEAVDYAEVDLMREAMIPVLRRHGYDLPGIVDLCAMAALRALSQARALPLGIEIHSEARAPSGRRVTLAG